MYDNKPYPDSKNLFEFKKIIGKGGFGRVWKVSEKKTRKLYALKVMDKAKIITKKSVNSVMNEREILCKLEHEFIVNMHCAFQDRENLYLVMDYLDGGDLRYYINRRYNFTEEQIRKPAFIQGSWCDA
jgi:serine/threonine protein kinase